MSRLGDAWMEAIEDGREEEFLAMFQLSEEKK